MLALSLVEKQIVVIPLFAQSIQYIQHLSVRPSMRLYSLLRMGSIETVLSSSIVVVAWSAFIVAGTMWYGIAVGYLGHPYFYTSKLDRVYADGVFRSYSRNIRVWTSSCHIHWDELLVWTSSCHIHWDELLVWTSSCHMELIGLF